MMGCLCIGGSTRDISLTEYRSEIYVKSDVKGKLVRIVLAEVTYIKAALNYVVIHPDEGKHVTYLTMNEVMEVLDPALFARVHKSFIVNRDKIRSIENGAVILRNKESVFIGGKYIEAFLKAIETVLVVSKIKESVYAWSFSNTRI